MSISNSLSNALSGLTASARMAEVVSSNLANAMTDGYGRRIVQLGAQSVGGRGAGVTVLGIERVVDRGVLADRRLADASLAGYSRSAASLVRLERTLGRTGDSDALSARFTALEEALVTASSDPSSDVRLGVTVERLRDVTQALHDADSEIRTLRESADADIASDVGTLNKALKRMERLNTDIVLAKSTGQDPSALMDQRQQVIDQISTIVPIREMERNNGQVALMTAAGQTLIDGPASEIGFAATPIIEPEMTLGTGALSGLTINGTPVAGGPGAGRLDGGSLGAAFALRDKTLVDAQSQLDHVARDILERFQGPAVDPTQSATDLGLLTDRGVAFDPLNTVGLAGRISINAMVDPAQGGATYRLRDGINAATPGPAGNGAQLDRWIGAMADSRALANGGSGASASGHAAGLVSMISGGLGTVEEDQSYASARWSSLREAELSQGVDSDQELQMLMRIEQSYAANARVIQTVDSMIQTLMDL